VRRYHAQSYCGDALIKCLLPFHDGPLFARAAALLDLQPGGSSGKALATWAPLLKPLQDRGAHKGSSLPRAALVARCLRDTALLGAVLATVEEALGARTLGRHPRLVALYGAVLLETLERMGPMTEAAMRLILPHLLTAVRARGPASGGVVPPEYQLASYMVLSKLASTTALAPPVASALLVALAEGLGGGGKSGKRRGEPQADAGEEAEEELEPRTRQELAARGLAAMAAVMHAQGLRALPKECLKHLVARPALVATAALALAQALPAAGGQLLAPALLRALGDGAGQGRVGPDAFLTYLAALSPLPAAAATLPEVIAGLARAGAGLTDGGKAREGVVVLLRELWQREDAKAAVQAATAALEEGVARAFLLAATGEGEEGEGPRAGASSALDLHLADGRKRAKALAALAERWAAGANGDEEGDSDDVAAVLAAFHDEEPSVALRALEADVLTPLAARAGPEAVGRALAAALAQWATRGHQGKKVHKVLRALLRAVPSAAAGEGGEEQRRLLLAAVVPFLRRSRAAASEQVVEEEEDGKAAARLLALHRAAAAALAAVAPALALPTDGGEGEAEAEGGDAAAAAAALEAAATATAAAVGQALLRAPTEAAVAVLSPLLAVPAGELAAEEAGRRAQGMQHALVWLGEGAAAAGEKEGGRQSTLAAAVVPLLLDALSHPVSPFGSLLPATALLAPLAALLQRLPSAQPQQQQQHPEGEHNKDDWTHADPTLLRLLSLPPWAQHGRGAGPAYQAALHALLAARHGAGALPALAAVAAAPDTSAAARVQALAAAATVVQALKAGPADAGTQRRFLWGEGVLDAKVMPASLAALAHAERRVREGAVLLLEAIFAPSPAPSSASSSGKAQRQQQQQQEEGGAKQQGGGKKKAIMVQTTAAATTPSSPPPNTPRSSATMNGHAEEEAEDADGATPSLPSPPMTRARRASLGNEGDLLTSPSPVVGGSKTPKSSSRRKSALPTLQEDEEEGEEAEGAAEEEEEQQQPQQPPPQQQQQSPPSKKGAVWLNAAALGGDLARLEALAGLAAALLQQSSRRLLLLGDGANAVAAVRALLSQQHAGSSSKPRSEAQSLALLIPPAAQPDAAATGPLALSLPARRHLARCLLRAAAAAPLPTPAAASVLLEMALDAATADAKEEMAALASRLAVAPTSSRARGLLLRRLPLTEQQGEKGDASLLLLRLLEGELAGTKAGVDGKEEEEGSVLAFLCRPYPAARDWATQALDAQGRAALWTALFTALTHDGAAAAAAAPIARVRLAAAGLLAPAELVARLLPVLGAGGGKGSAKKGGGSKGGGSPVSQSVAVAALEMVQQARQLQLSAPASSAEVEEEEEKEKGSSWSPLVAPIAALLSTPQQQQQQQQQEAQADEDGEGEFVQLLALETLMEVAGDGDGVDAPALLALLEASPSLHVRNACLRLLAKLARGGGEGLRAAALARVLAWLGRETVQQPDAYSFSLVLRVRTLRGGDGGVGVDLDD
jgi:hypothetical protein